MNSMWIASQIGLWIAVVVLTIIVLGLVRQIGLLQIRFGDGGGALITPQGIERGEIAPNFSLVRARTGERVSLNDVAGRRALVAFLSVSCTACHEAVPIINGAADDNPEMPVLTVCRGDSRTVLESFGARLGNNVWLLADETGRVEADWDVPATPFFYLLDEDGRVLIRGVANSWSHLEAFLREEGTFQGGREWIRVPGDGELVDHAD